MRQFLITILALFLAIENAHAFQYFGTKQKTSNLIESFKGKSQQQRLELLKSFKDSLHEYIENFELPDINSTPDDDPRLAEYASLTEFEGYLDLALDKLEKTGCKNVSMTSGRIKSSASQSGEEEVDEATLARKILAELCK
ncbi:MAG: hypothetical protein ACXWRA_14795 [Pseudobdellovibrionaceae bacterium]